MYNSFYKLEENPFSLNPDPRFLFPSKQQENAFKFLMYGIKNSEGLIEIVGEVGCGKTLLCRRILSALKDTAKTAYILNAPPTEIEFLEALMADLGLPSKNKNRQELVQHLSIFLAQEYANNSRVVIVIDEAQELSAELFSTIRFLTNLETEKKKLIQVIMVGQLELDTRLHSSELRALDQRVALRYQLMPLNKKEVEQYIYHRLHTAGTVQISFTMSAISKIYKFSQGIPRLINMVCDKSLIAAGSLEKNKIDGKIIADTLKSTQKRWEVQPKRTLISATPRMALVGLCGVLLVAAVGIVKTRDLQELLHEKRSKEVELVKVKKAVDKLAQEKTKKELELDKLAKIAETKIAEGNKKKQLELIKKEELLKQLNNEKKALKQLAKEKEAKELELIKKNRILKKLAREKQTKQVELVQEKRALEQLTKLSKDQEFALNEEKKAREKLFAQKQVKEQELAKKEEALKLLAKEKQAKEQELAKKEEALKKLDQEKKAKETLLTKAQEESRLLLKQKEERVAQLAEKEKALKKLTEETVAKKLVLTKKEDTLKRLEEEKKAKEQELAQTTIAREQLVKEKQAMELVLSKEKGSKQDLVKARQAKEEELAEKEKILKKLFDEKEAKEKELAQAHQAKEEIFREKQATELALDKEQKIKETLLKEKEASELELVKKARLLKKLAHEKEAKELELAQEKRVLEQLTKLNKDQEFVLKEEKIAREKLLAEKKVNEAELAKKEESLKQLTEDKQTREKELAKKELALKKLDEEKKAKEAALAQVQGALQLLVQEKQSQELKLAEKEKALQRLAKEKEAKELVIAQKETLLRLLIKEKEAKAIELAKIKDINQQLLKDNEAKELELKIKSKQVALFQEKKLLDSLINEKARRDGNVNGGADDLSRSIGQTVLQAPSSESMALTSLFKSWGYDVKDDEAVGWPLRKDSSLDFEAVARKYGLEAVTLDTDFNKLLTLNLPCIIFPETGNKSAISYPVVLSRRVGGKVYSQNGISYSTKELASWQGKAVVFWQNIDNLGAGEIALDLKRQGILKVAQRLRQLGYLTKSAPNSQQLGNALKSFQKDHSIATKGVVDTYTKLMLYKVINQPATPTLSKEFG